MDSSNSIGTVVIGGGQAGLATGYHLKKRGVSFAILDANDRVGDSWRKRWDSLRLFTPAHYDGLPGLRFPGKPFRAPNKDEFADYLESYAERMALPVRPRVKVERVSKASGRFVLDTSDGRLEADQVVVATGAFQVPKVPPFARELDPRIVQLHSVDYRNPLQLREGPVLVVGVGNSGADISIELAQSHPTWLAGHESGHIPVRIDSFKARFVLRLVRFMGHHILTRGTPMGRKAMPHMAKGATPLIRVKPKDILAAGITRVPRVTGVREGLPLLDDGRTLKVANVVWCTGFGADFSWIELPVFSGEGRPIHRRGIVPDEPGLYFVGLHLQYAATSDVITGVPRDAEYVVKHIAGRRRTADRPAEAVRS